MAALDPYRGYASALRTALPHAVRVLDAFHVVRLGFAAVDDVRRRIQREQTGRRGHRDDPLYGIRRLLRRAPDHHSDRSWQRLLAGLDAGDTDDEQLARTPALRRRLEHYPRTPDQMSATTLCGVEPYIHPLLIPLRLSWPIERITALDAVQ